MENHISKLVVGSLMGSLIFGASYAHIELGLNPAEVCATLNERLTSGEINENTLIVFDVDDTLIESSSDTKTGGPILLNKQLPEVIKKAKEYGAAVVALTQVDVTFNNRFAVGDGELIVTEATPKELPNGFIPETARIHGLQSVGIDLNNPEFLRLPRVFPCITKDYDRRLDLRKETIIGTFGGNKNKSKWEYFSTVMGTATPDGPVYFIRDNETNTLQEVLCAPVFSEGIIFTNHFSKERQNSDAKGPCLLLFLALYKDICGREFSNIIFVDDKFNNVLDVEGAVRCGLGKECLAIQICRQLKK
ncbi:MAG: DUF2608 domain-containing protein [Puniceicoccales bacterium]|jgi:hypothetical protein|nr:DUF2608 domain-containing protein [Puniceicoccales bacterium]